MFNNNNQIFRFMKKIKYFGLMGAIALTSAIGFTACSSDDSATADVNPTYDGTSVRTDFAFNVTKASQGTRMSGGNVQEGDGNGFLGMKRMFLLPFDEEPVADADKTTNANIFYLGDLATSEIYASPSKLSKKIYSLTLPVGTNNFLFYGTSAASGTNFQKGKVSSNFWSVSGDVETPSGSSAQMSTDGIHFDLTSIATSLGTDATNIAQYLTNIANAETNDHKTWASTVETAETQGTYSAIALLYSKFIKNMTQYAGSKEAVERLVFDLYKTAYAINAQSSVEDVQNIAKAICKAIETPYNNVVLKVQKSSSNTDQVLIENNLDVSTASNWEATLDGTTTSGETPNIKYFPANLGLPMGAAQLKWSGTAFAYKTNTDLGNTTDTSVPVTDIAATAAITDYCYPAEIIYFDNSPLIATNQYKRVIDYPTTSANWDAVHGTDGAFDNTWTQPAVAADTRAVAMTNNVNYGVALLETTVKVNNTGKMADNMAAIIGGTATDQEITASNTRDDANKKSVFKVTGVLVGGQPAQVGWNMIPTSNSFSSVIYDKDVTFTDALSTTSDNTKNYTVVFDNYYNSSTQQNNVLIALEIVNDGCDFYGAEGLIPAGNTFYLIGMLDVNGTTDNGVTDKTIPEIRSGVKRNATQSTYRITNEGVKRVFVQDYKTVANLTLKNDALKRAYSAIPDLRATEVLFGLSVDLKWETGMKFEVEM